VNQSRKNLIKYLFIVTCIEGHQSLNLSDIAATIYLKYC
jgi:hypothetical protein